MRESMKKNNSPSSSCCYALFQQPLRFIIEIYSAYCSRGAYFFSPERRGWKEGLNCARTAHRYSPLTESHLQPFIPQLVPRGDGRDWSPRVEPQVKQRRQRGWCRGGGTVGKWRGVGLGVGGDVWIGDCRSCQRVGESGELSSLVRSYWRGRVGTDTWMRLISPLSGWELLLFVVVLVHRVKIVHWHRRKQDWLIELLGKEFMHWLLMRPICQNGSSTVSIPLWTSVQPKRR